MASSDPSDQTTPKRNPVTGAEIVMRMLGNDPWMRYDLWASRAWEAAEKASALALSSAPPISSDDVVFDPRVAALFHSAEVAKEFAEMVNPLTAVGDGEFDYDMGQNEDREVVFSVMAEPEDTDTD